MSILLTTLLSLLVLVLLAAGGIYIWYRFKWLKQPQLFLVSVPYKDLPLDFKSGEPAVLAKLYKGRWATKADLVDALNRGMYLEQAGYLADVTHPDAGCDNNPKALYTDVELGVRKLSSACGRGYYIVGEKPSKSGAAVGKTNYSVQPWNQTTGQWNYFELDSFSAFWKALTGR